MSQLLQARRRHTTGNSFQFTAAADLSVGQVVVIDGILGIVEHPYKSGDLASASKVGIFDVVKVTGAISRGAIVYWDENGNPLGGTAGSGCATTTSGGNIPMGRVMAAALETDEKVQVRLFDAETVTNTVTSVAPATNEIADPGDAGAIPVSASGTVMLVSGASGETRTIADPEELGQEITLTMLTDGGGDIVIASASPVNQTGNNRLTFGAVRDTIKLVSIEAAASLEWAVAFNDGVALSTV